MQRHGHDNVETPLARKGLPQETSERPRQRPHALEFEKMDQLAQRAVINARRENLVESIEAEPA